MGGVTECITILLLACTVHALPSNSSEPSCLLQTAIHPAVNPALQDEPKIRAKTDILLPNMIIQWGEPRTATTLQFQSLCLLLTIMNPEKTKCAFVWPDHWEEESNVSGLIHDSSSILVLKVHDEQIMKNVRKRGLEAGRDVWLFATADNETAGSDGNFVDWQPTARHLSNSLHIDVKYAQVISLLSARGHHILEDYKAIFDLSDEQTDNMIAYMRYWDVLRQCCGTQMSEDWRGILVGSHAIPHHDPSDSAYPACQVYDLDEVEQALINLPVYQEFALKGPFQLRTASNLDKDFSGSYCSWFQRQVRCQKLNFNALPREPYC